MNSLFSLPLLQQAPRWIIAYSGGLDSHVLLHLSQQAAINQSKKILVVHVHHGLSPFADEWLTHCEATAKALSLPFESVKVKVELQKGESLEACARTARYAALANFVEEGDVLLTAHHLDDQAETFLLQLLRGSGVKGLASMPIVKKFSEGYLVRPLLNTSHPEILNYATENNLVWIRDESNSNTDFDRNFLRHEIIPKLKSRWPALSTVLNRSAKQLAESDALLMELGRGDYRPIVASIAAQPSSFRRCEERSDVAIQSPPCQGRVREGLRDLTEETPSSSPLTGGGQSQTTSSRCRVPPLHRGEFKNLDCRVANAPRNDETLDCAAMLATTGFNTGIIDRLSIPHLKTLSRARLHNALRAWLYDCKIPLPSDALLSRIAPDLLDSASDKQGCITWEGYTLRSFEEDLYLSHFLAAFDPKQVYKWDMTTDLVLPIGTLTPSLKQILKLESYTSVEVCFRQGGERFHPEGRAHSQTLKKLFQEWHIPTWLRDRVPLFYVEDKLVGVLGYPKA